MNMYPCNRRVSLPSVPPARLEGDEVSIKKKVILGKMLRNDCLNVGGVSVGRRNDAPSRKGCVANGRSSND